MSFTESQEIDDDDFYDFEYEDEDVLEIGAGDASISPETAILPFKTQSLTTPDIIAEMDTLIAQAQHSLPPDLSADAVKIALDLHSWNPDDLLINTFDYPDGEQAYFTSLNVPFGLDPAPTSSLEPVTCALCAMPSSDIHTHRCGAKICLTCWQEYIHTEVVDNNHAHIVCPSCPLYLECRLVQELSNSGVVKTRIQSAILESFIHKSRRHSWCPAPNCGRIIRIRDANYDGWKIGHCTCDEVSCLSCSKLWHGPLDCETNTRWGCLVNHNYADTHEWLLVNSKPCPKCTTPIQKTGGCNFMTCSNPSCGYKFCWICLQRGHDHGYGETCAKYKDPSSPVSGGVRLTHERYKYYSTRYYNMIDCAELEEGNYVANLIQDCKMQLTAGGCVQHELSYLDDILSVMKRSKRTIAHSYALLCLTQTNPERDCFENTLEVFQAKVDGVIYFLENVLEKITSPVEISSRVKDNLNFCRTRAQLIDEISEYNYNNGIWKFIQKN